MKLLSGMALLTIRKGVTGIATPRVGPRLDGMNIAEVSAMHFFLNAVPPLVTVDAKHGITVALSARFGVLFRVYLMPRLPVGLVV